MIKQKLISGKVKSTILASSLVLGILAQPAQANLTFNFNYLSTGQGFQDPTLGADRQVALNNAASALGAYFSNYTATLTYDVTSVNTNDVWLASAGSGSFVVPGTFQKTEVQEKIINNNNVASENANGYINWNFAYDWGLGDTVGATQYDFKSTAIHELLHTFGFTSFVGIGGTGLDGMAPGTPDTWATYDNFLTDSAGNRLISTSGVFDSAEVVALTAGTTNSTGVLFSGAYAKAANNGASIPIYSPSIWSDGSSIAHLDDNSLVTSTSIMNANAHNLGLDTRTLGALELGILKDIGYTNVSAVPVPATVWLMLSGLLGLLGLNRRKVAL